MANLKKVKVEVDLAIVDLAQPIKLREAKFTAPYRHVPGTLIGPIIPPAQLAGLQARGALGEGDE